MFPNRAASLAGRRALIAVGALLLCALIFYSNLPKPSAPRVEARLNVVGISNGGSFAWVIRTARGVVLIDTGVDPTGRAIIEELERQKLSPAHVHTILLTHGHVDHWSAASVFPNARVYLSAEDKPLVSGERKPSAFFPKLASLFVPRPTVPPRIDALTDGQSLDLDGELFRAFLIPGHTPGSTAFLYQDILFTGDALVREGVDEVRMMPVGFSENSSQNLDSLKQLVAQPFTRIADGHSGVTEDARQKLRALIQ
jgi:hydroxyacylglutathione hydrolase